MAVIAEKHDAYHVDERLEVVREIIRLLRELEKLGRHEGPGTLQPCLSETRHCDITEQCTHRAPALTALESTVGVHVFGQIPIN